MQLLNYSINHPNKSFFPKDEINKQNFSFLYSDSSLRILYSYLLPSNNLLSAIRTIEMYSNKSFASIRSEVSSSNTSFISIRPDV